MRIYVELNYPLLEGRMLEVCEQVAEAKDSGSVLITFQNISNYRTETLVSSAESHYDAEGRRWVIGIPISYSGGPGFNSWYEIRQFWPNDSGLPHSLRDRRQGI
jgi:hypothetical protein